MYCATTRGSSPSWSILLRSHVPSPATCLIQSDECGDCRAAPGGAAKALLLASAGIDVTLRERGTSSERVFRGEGPMPSRADALLQVASPFGILVTTSAVGAGNPRITPSQQDRGTMAEHANVVRMARFRPAAGRREDLLSRLKNGVDGIRQRDGCFGAQICTLREVPDTIVVISRWESQAALDQFLSDTTAQRAEAAA